MRVIIDNKKIGNNIKVLRDNKKQSINELSSMTGIADDILINYESGKKQITINNLIIICNYFNVTIDSVISYQIL